MKQSKILEAALVEREEYLEELKSLHEAIGQQILTLEEDIDKLLLEFFKSRQT